MLYHMQRISQRNLTALLHVRCGSTILNRRQSSAFCPCLDLVLDNTVGVLETIVLNVEKQ